MSRTHIQQSQISGSLSFDDTLPVNLADALTIADNRTLVSDLNDIRKQLNRVIGRTAWSDALSGEQDLADIYAAVHMSSANAAFQGEISVVGAADLNGSLDVAGQVDLAASGVATSVRGTLSVAEGATFTGAIDANSSADFQGAVNLQDTLTVAQATDLNGSLDVAGQVDLAAAGVATSIRGTLSVAEGATFTGAIDANSSADFQGAVNLQSTLDVAGKGYFAGIVDVDGTLSASVIKIDGDAPAGALYLVGAAGEIAESDKLFFDGSMMQLTGSLDVSAGLNVASGGLTVAGDRLEVTGTFGLSGDAAIGGALEVTGGVTGSAGLKIAGDADFNGPADFAGAVNMQSTLSVASAATFDGGIDVNGSGITAASIKIDSDVTGRLYVVDGSGYISDEALLNFSGGELQVTGSLKVTSSALVEGALDVVGALNVDGAADFDSTADFAGAVVMQSSLDVDGAVDLDSTLDVQGNAMFRANVDVVGNLTVQGSMTYIETQNLKVLDAFIHLATGSTGTQSSGIVLHGGAGASDDIMLAQDAGGGEFVFAKVKQSEHGDVDGSNAITVDAAELIPAWMSGLKVGALEGSLSGSLAASAAGMDLQSAAGKDLLVKAGSGVGANLYLQANGESPISFIESGQYAAFDLQFPGMSLVAAIVAAGGNFKQDSFKPGIKSAGDAIDYSSVGALRAASYATLAAKKLAMDVFLNGVRLAYGDDYSIAGPSDPTPGELTFTMATMADDSVTVVIHNAAA